MPEWGWGWDNARAFLGIALIFSIAWAISEDRRAFPWKIVLGAVALQFAFAIALFAIPPVRTVLLSANVLVDALVGATARGTEFVFGPVFGTQAGWEGVTGAPGPIFAVHLLPLVIVVAALSAILWHWRILRWVTKGFAAVFRRLLGLGGATSLAVSANVFMGMTEAPILVKPYLKGMTRSEIFILMVAGFATVAGSVMVLYAVFLGDLLDNALAQLLTASIVAAPAAVALALVIVPERTAPADRAHEPDFNYRSTMDAFATGATDGLKIVANIVTMIIAALALLYLVNLVLGALPLSLPGPDGAAAPLSVELILGWVFAPIAYMIGVPAGDAVTVGSLLGVKAVLTEFVAFLQLQQGVGAELDERTRVIAVHALNGFANFASVGILIGGLSIIEPARRETVLDLAWKTLVAGSLATCLSAAVVAALPFALFDIA